MKPHNNTLRLLFWETTCRCNLACTHCRRLDTTAARAAGDLTTEQARKLIDSAVTLGRPVIVFSGGEPLLRKDWEELAGHARAKGLPTALASNGTLIDDALAARIAAAGFHRVSVSLDGPDAATNDVFRGPGAFEQARAGVLALRRAGVAVQINSTIAAHNADRLDQLHDLAVGLGAVALHLFLLVPVGCGQDIAPTAQLSPRRYEEVLNWMWEKQARVAGVSAPEEHGLQVPARRDATHGAGVPPAAKRNMGVSPMRPTGVPPVEERGAGVSPAEERGEGVRPTNTACKQAVPPAVLELKATCAPQYYRIANQRRTTGILPVSPTGVPPVEEHGLQVPARRDANHAPGGTGHSRGCLAGLAVIFISHDGEVFPCGYLPVSCGNVKRQELRDIWESAPILAKLRDFDLLTGNCGACGFKTLCGGCRARAFAATGDYLAGEPSCIY